VLASSPENIIQAAATAEALRARSAPGKKNGKLPRSTRADNGTVVVVVLPINRKLLLLPTTDSAEESGELDQVTRKI